ncbi:hypothetical protein NP493_536g00009 [Ridgeia piscesae]|uniref:Uncharacterized protein n=1 Tax=Ridgeia piscesae TaxID=27915 RepID=A0AAD9KWH1_RIDPI|nr:hypothetical protein NP493_536g00009 [Ridgeia piscesae]
MTTGRRAVFKMAVVDASESDGESVASLERGDGQEQLGCVVSTVRQDSLVHVLVLQDMVWMGRREERVGLVLKANVEMVEPDRQVTKAAQDRPVLRVLTRKSLVRIIPAESHTVVTLELVWPACLTVVLAIVTTFLLVRYRRVLTVLQTQKTYAVRYTAAARPQSAVTVASTDTRLTDTGEMNAAMDGSSLKEMTKYESLQ